MAAEQPATTPRGGAPPAVSAAAGDQRSTGQIVKDVLSETQTLIRKEIELAKHEISEAAAARAMAVGAGVAGGVMALFGLGFAGATAAKALEEVFAPWLAWLIVTGAFFLIAVVALLIARNRATAVPMQPERTQASIQENVEWAKQQLKR